MHRLSALRIAATAVAIAAGPALADTAEIVAAQAAWEEAFATGDGAAAAEAVFTEDARLLPPDGPVIEGREAIGQYWQGVMDAGVHSLELGLIAAETHGDAMIETGTWAARVPNADGTEVEVGGNALVVWKKGADGNWRMSHDMWSNAP